ncbi:MAG: histidinol-phosphatase HisJ family protein [Candidatus Bathyarchaeota archaeon]|nr:histidinol-phosphatase HisJ family protein [Candidatus Bathyarchaeota archaeon]
MRLDYHMHTRFSDGRSDLSDHVAEAAKRKIDEIGFSDHIHFRKEDWSMDHADLPRYVDNINTLKKKSQISIKMGLEVDFVPYLMEDLMQMIKQWDFDYLIGSVHHIGDWLVDSEKEIEEWKRRDVDQVYRQYFNLVQAMAKTQLFDIVGHLDLVKKFNHQPKNDLGDLLLETVQTIGKSGMCIEINTGGLRKPCREIYPSEKLLKMCFDNGLPITFGSDAHSPEDVGAGFHKAEDLVKRVGYVEIARFTRRERDFVEL